MAGATKRKGRSTGTILVVALVVVVGGVWLWRRANAPVVVTFRTAKVDRGSVEATVTATGSLNAVVTVQVGSQVSGIIAKLGADFNSKVTEGQIIAQIDPTRFKANLAQAEAALKSAEASLVHADVAVREAKVELDRAKPLADKKVIGAADLDAAQSKYDQAVADKASADAQVGQSRANASVARVDLEHTTIRAPISGTVLQRSVDVGQTVAASMQAPVLFTIAQDLSRMEVHAAIDEADVGKLHEQQEAVFTVDAYPGETFHGTIFQIRSQPTVTQNVVTYDAVLRVENPDGRLRPGMTASVRAVSQKHENVLRIPNSALRFRPTPDLIEVASNNRPDGGAPFGGPGASGGGRQRGAGGPGGGGDSKGAGTRWAKVYEANGSKVNAVRFRPGIADDEFTEIVQGHLQEGDEVVIEAIGGGAGGPPSGGAPGGQNRRPGGPRMF
ncbi:MAG TPA: efflux RND transporter periplasmic adaptor subunit [Polyangia bacterium]|nr:efflux RND transporter periplasmic adaptor subunit [Polyangia bacterium]